MDAEVVTLPVIRIEREPVDPSRPVDRERVTDINAYRYRMERARVERRALQSLLPDEDGA